MPPGDRPRDRGGVAAERRGQRGGARSRAGPRARGGRRGVGVRGDRGAGRDRPPPRRAPGVRRARRARRARAWSACGPRSPAAGVAAEVSTDITRVLWEKYLLIGAQAGMTALTRAPIGVIRSTAGDAGACTGGWSKSSRRWAGPAESAWRPTWSTRSCATPGRSRRAVYSSLHTRPHAGPASGARGAARSRGAAGRAPRRGHADALRRLRRAPAARRRCQPGEARLSRPVAPTPAREVWRCLHRYRVRYALGIVCLAAATGAVAGDSVDGEAGHRRAARRGRGRPARPLRRASSCSAPPATASRGWPRGSRSSADRSALRPTCCARLYAALQTFPPAAFARFTTGDLMARATSDVTAIRSLVGFGTISTVSTALAFVGALAAMLAVDPWLTLWAMAPVAGAGVPGAPVQRAPSPSARTRRRSGWATSRRSCRSDWPAWRSCAPTRWRRGRRREFAAANAVPPRRRGGPGQDAGALRAADGPDRRRRHAGRHLGRGQRGRRAAG